MITEIRPQLGIEKGQSTPDGMRKKIMELEEAMMGMPNDHIDIKTTHHFAPGVYMREVLIPQGALVVGKIHKTEHMNILSQGELIVYTEDGMKKLQASTVTKSNPGIKRVGYALQDSVWITVHPNVTNEKDVDKIENMLIAPNFTAVGHYTKKPEVV